MLSLFRMDLYRSLHGKELRSWIIALCATFAFVVLFLFFLTTPQFAQVVAANGGSDPSAASAGEAVALNALADFSDTPTRVWGDLAVAVLVSLAASAFMVVHAAADFKCGYARNILSARTGRGAYFASKLVLAAVVSVLFLVVALFVVNVLWAVLGFSYAEGEGALDILSWCGCIELTLLTA